MINADDLKYFLELTSTLHVSRAAERLGITQPALSHCIKRIEQQLGTPIVIRTKRGVILTTAGQKLQDKARELSAHWAKLLEEVKQDRDEVSGTIRLGCHTSVAQYTLPKFIPQLLLDHQKLEVQLTHGLSRHITEQVISSKLDVGLVVNPVAHPDLIIKTILNDQVTLWRTADCLNLDVLLIDPNLLQTQNILAKLAKRKMNFARVIESSSLEVLAHLLIANAGCAILPEKVIRALSDTRIQKVKDAPVFEDKIALIYPREFVRTRRGKVFSQTVVQALS